MKTCSMCGETKKKEEFRPERARATRRANCRKCDTVRHKDWRAKNRERIREYDRGRWRKRDRWNNHISRTYGLTPVVYDELLKRQGGKCAICSTADPGGDNGRFHVDHNHETKEVRGLLCGQCNRMLGSVGDNPETLRRGAEYLVAPQAEAFVRAYMEIKG